MGSAPQMQCLDDVILRNSANIDQNSEILMYMEFVVFNTTVYSR